MPESLTALLVTSEVAADAGAVSGGLAAGEAGLDVAGSVGLTDAGLAEGGIDAASGIGSFGGAAGDIGSIGDLGAGVGDLGGGAAGGGGFGGLAQMLGISPETSDALGVLSGINSAGNAGQDFASGNIGQGFLDATQAAIGVAGAGVGSLTDTAVAGYPDVSEINAAPLSIAENLPSAMEFPELNNLVIGPGGTFNQAGNEIFNPATNTIDLTTPGNAVSADTGIIEQLYKGDPTFNTTSEIFTGDTDNPADVTTGTLANPDYVAPTEPTPELATPTAPVEPPPVPIAPVTGGLEGIGAAPGAGAGVPTGGSGGASGLAGSLSGTAINPTGTPAPLDTGVASGGGAAGNVGGSSALDINATPLDSGASPAVDPSGNANAPITGVPADAGAVAPQLGDVTGDVQLGDAGGAAQIPTSSPGPTEDLGAGGFGAAQVPADLPPSPADYSAASGGAEGAALLNDPGNVALAGLNGSSGQSLLAEGGGGDNVLSGGGPGAGDDAITPPSFDSLYGPQQPLTAPDVPGPQTTVTDPSAFTPGGSSDSFLEQLGLGGGLGDIGSFLKGNSNVIMPAVGLGAAGLKQLMTPAIPNQSALTGDAAQLQSLFNQFNPSNPSSPANSPTQGLVTSAANALIPAEQTGQLAAGQQSIVDQALQDQITTLKSQAATRGESADPALNTGLAQQIAAAQNQATEISANMAAQETQTGLAAANQVAQTALGYTSAALQSVGLSSQVYLQLAALTLQQNAALGQAITGFSTAAGYGAGLEALKQGTTTTSTV